MFLKNFSIAGNKFKIFYYTVSFSYLIITKLLSRVSLITISIFILFSVLLFILQVKSSRESHDNVSLATLAPDKDIPLNNLRRSTSRNLKYKNLLFPAGILLGTIFSYLSFRLFYPLIQKSDNIIVLNNGDLVPFKGIILRLPGILVPLQLYEIVSFVIGIFIVFIFFFIFKFKKVVNIGIGYGLGSAFNIVLLAPASNDFVFTVVFTTAIFYSISLLLEPKRKWKLIFMPIYAYVIIGIIYLLPNILFKNGMKDFWIQENTFEINSLGTTSIYYPFPYKFTPFLRVDVQNNVIPPKKIVFNIIKQEPDHFDIDVKLATLPVEFKYHAEGQRKPPN